MSDWFDLAAWPVFLLALNAKWRQWFSTLIKASKTSEATPTQEDPKILGLQAKIAKLEEVNRQQQHNILYLKEINYQLQEKSQMLTDFIAKGPWAQQEKQHGQTAAVLSGLSQDLAPIISGLESGDYSKFTAERLNRLRLRSKAIEAQIAKMREEMGRQRQELLNKLAEKEASLKLQESDLESLSVANRKLQEEVKKLRSANHALEEEVRIKNQLEQALTKSENSFKILAKKYRDLQAQMQQAHASQGLVQENQYLKKTVALLQQKLAQATKKAASLKLEYEQLLGEYERLFSNL